MSSHLIAAVEGVQYSAVEYSTVECSIVQYITVHRVLLLRQRILIALRYLLLTSDRARRTANLYSLLPLACENSGITVYCTRLYAYVA